MRETITLSSLYKDEAGALKALLKRSGVKETDAWWKQEFALGSDELGGSVQAPANDDGVMIASLIDGAAEKNMDMELVAALAADAMTPASKGAQRSFADESVEASVNDSALAADVEAFMKGSSESLSLEAHQFLLESYTKWLGCETIYTF